MDILICLYIYTTSLLFVYSMKVKKKGRYIDTKREKEIEGSRREREREWVSERGRRESRLNTVCNLHAE